MTDGEVELKFHAQADPILGRGRADSVLGWLWQLENASKWDDLAALLLVEQA